MHKTDANHVEISQALRNAMCSVVDLSAVAGGCPDLLVGRGGVNYLLEIKDGKNDLNDKQELWFSRWRGRAVVVRNVDEALKAVGL